ncbi:hypothetical protein C8T65DRAFT_745680 [Cerioporus squamosus]|nr:hypothetical protein C8T65DRAFT_745680 [Cerioporus squamosus]
MFVPLPRNYAVAQIDLPASLRGLGKLDSKAKNALRTIRCLKSIIMLHTANGLPNPRIPDCKYFVYVVGPGLRPEDPEQCYTADMCMPIFPNTYHPTGRPPVRTVPEFPFSNCYHWFGPDISLMLRVKNRTYGDPQYIDLPAGDYVDMEDFHGEDMNRIIVMRAEQGKRTGPPDTDHRPDGDVEPSPAAKHNPDVFPEDDDNTYFGPDADENDTDSLASGASDLYTESQDHSCLSLPSATDNDSVTSVTESDIFKMFRNESALVSPW